MLMWVFTNSTLTLFYCSARQDEGARLRKLAVKETVSSTPAISSHHTVIEAPNALPPVVYLIAAVILGLIIGKFIL